MSRPDPSPPVPRSSTPASTASDSDVAVQAVFRRALRDMLLLIAVLAVVGVAVGALLAGSAGVWGAVLGVLVALVFSGTTVVSMLVTARSAPTTMAAVVLGAWLAKMVALVVLLVVLGDQTFYHRPTFGVVCFAGVLGSVALDLRAVLRGRVPYTDPGAVGHQL